MWNPKMIATLLKVAPPKAEQPLRVSAGRAARQPSPRQASAQTKSGYAPK